MNNNNLMRRLDWLIPQWLEDVDAYSQSIDEDMIAVCYTIIVNFIILIICILFFSIIRQYGKYINLFSPRCAILPDRTPPRISNKSLFGWVIDIYNIDDQLIIDKGGYDILFIIRFYRLCFKILLVSSIYCWIVLLPINGFGNASSDYTSFDRWSMTNISQQSGRCWFHLIGIYIFSFVTIYFLEKEYIVYAKYRHIFLRQTHAHLRTVIVEGIPNKLRSTSTLRTYFEALYPNSILHVRLAQNLRYLDRLISHRDTIVSKLERYLYMYHNDGLRPTVKVGNMIDGVDAIKYYTQLLEESNSMIEKEQQIANEFNSNSANSPKPTSSSGKQVLDEFLKVTEIGGSQKLANNNNNNNNNNSNHRKEDIYDSSNFSSYQNEDFSNRNKETEVKDSLSENDLNFIRPLRIYRMSWSDWFRAMWRSPTLIDCWDVVKQLRYAEDHSPIPTDGSYNNSSDEQTSLISPPEERRLFLSKAFVTFKTFKAATISRQVVHMQLAGRMSISEAPEPSDITWTNLYASRKGTLVRTFIVEALVLFLIITWVAPVTLLSFVFSKSALSGYFPFIGTWCKHSRIFDSLIELAQPLVLVGIMNLLPPILNFLGVIEGCVSFSSNQFRSFDRYFTFQIINIFLVTTIAGSVIDCVKEIYSEPASAFSLLGSSLPRMGGFFTNYILVKAFTGLGIELIRLPAMAIGFMKVYLTHHTTPRDKRSTPLEGALRGVDTPGWFPSAKIYAQDMLLFVVCATYSCIAPLILLAGLCYFAGAAYVYKHQLLFVYVPICETGGKWWPKMARCFVVALLFAQATMVGMMLLKEAYAEVYLLVLIVGLTSSYMWYVSSLYGPLADQLPLDMAISMDHDLLNTSAVGGIDSLATGTDLDGADDYMQPSLRAPRVQPEVEFPLESMNNSRYNNNSNYESSRDRGDDFITV